MLCPANAHHHFVFDDIYSRCSDHFVAQSLPPPSKKLLSKQIVGLFHPEHFIIREHGERYSAYKNLKIRIPTSTNQSITVPDHCSGIITQNNELKVTCNREFIVNGRQLSCSVLFGVSKTSLSVNESNVPLNIHIPPSESTVAGMVFIMEQLKLCKGAPCDSSISECAHWTIMGNENTHEFWIRSGTCQKLLSVGSTVEFCKPCAEKLQRESKK